LEQVGGILKALEGMGVYPALMGPRLNGKGRSGKGKNEIGKF
jgi:hypothetical protein